jgi:hypothetical protein
VPLPRLRPLLRPRSGAGLGLPSLAGPRAALFPKLFKGPLYPPNTLLMVDRLVKAEFLIEVEAVVRGRTV